jgi:predicted nucleic acid-binding protein
LLTSRLSDVEVTRVVRIANPALSAEADRLLRSCVRVTVSDDVIESARRLASSRLRTLDALHLATALHVGARRMLTYDHRLIEAASAEGLRVLHPGLAA